MLRSRVTLGLLAAAFTVAFVSAGLAADAGQGAVLAKRWCVDCHVVSASQERGSAQVPPFSEIAKRKGLTAASIALFLLRPHPPMPDMSLSRAEAADLAAYIASQR